MRLIDLTGNTYGQLGVLGRAGSSVGGKPLWRCRCECGSEKIVQGGNLKNGHTQSCGCIRGENHGLSDATEHRIWSHMRQRCGNSNDRAFANYGGRGIAVCERWQSFTQFLQDMGECPEGRSIDRIDNDGDYEPGNCRWATAKEQANNRRSTRWIVYRGERKTLKQWSEETGLGCDTIKERLNSGWSIKDALTTAPSAKMINGNNRWLTLDGRKQTLSQWSKEAGIGWCTIKARLGRGWSVRKSLTTLVRRKGC